MQQYFLPTLRDKMNHTISITGDDARHISRVMRMKPNDRIVCVTKDGFSALCEIVRLTAQSVQCRILEWIEFHSELPVTVVLANGLPKGDKLEMIVQKGTELGAAKFIPFNAARSVVKWDEKKIQKKIERWNKIAKEAAEQSHRNKIPEVLKPFSFQEMIACARKADVKIVAYEESAKSGEAKRLYQALNSLKTGETLFAVFGPEGGFAKEEIEELVREGFITCGFGPRILRTETAPLYLLSAVSYHFELMR